MNNIVKNIFACGYMGLVIIGLILRITKSFGQLTGNIFVILLIVFTIGFMFVLRQEETKELENNNGDKDEEIKSN
jgi:nitrate/nitrite transporter NarK